MGNGYVSHFTALYEVGNQSYFWASKAKAISAITRTMNPSIDLSSSVSQPACAAILKNLPNAP